MDPGQRGETASAANIPWSGVHGKSEPGEKHWHGASPTTAMTHIVIQEALEGKAVDWMEKVTDEQHAQHSAR